MKNPFKKPPPPKPGKLFVLSGPGGVGKKTLEYELLREIPDLYRPITVTTRFPRPGEVPGVDYYFVSNADFEAKFKNDEFLEYTRILNAWFGSLTAPIRDKLYAGVNVLLEVDVHGGLSVKRQVPQAVLIFLMPPDKETLRERMLKRGTDSELDIEARLKQADQEMKTGREEYDYVVVDDDLRTAVEEVKNIITEHTGTLDA